MIYMILFAKENGLKFHRTLPSYQEALLSALRSIKMYPYPVFIAKFDPKLAKDQTELVIKLQHIFETEGSISYSDF